MRTGWFPNGVPAEEKREDTDSIPRRVVIETKEKIPREFYIKKEDAEKYGYTNGVRRLFQLVQGIVADQAQ